MKFWGLFDEEQLDLVFKVLGEEFFGPGGEAVCPALGVEGDHGVRGEIAGVDGGDEVGTIRK